MPLYDFRCRGCGHDFEALVRRQDPPTACPSCGSADVDRQMSVFAVSSSERTRASADKARKKAAATAHRDNVALERELEAHRTEDH
jgi:putative FmdB family regulatory protein